MGMMMGYVINSGDFYGGYVKRDMSRQSDQHDVLPRLVGETWVDRPVDRPVDLYFW